GGDPEMSPNLTNQAAPSSSEPSPEAIESPGSGVGLELIVLGVAQDAGVPHAGCRRDCCAPAWADPSRRRAPACLGILDRRTSARWLVEATPELPLQLQRLLEWAEPDGRRPILDGLFLTHAHIGHYLGLAQLGRESLGTRGVPVYVMPRLRRFLEENGPWSQLVALGNIELRTLSEGEAVEIAPGLEVDPIEVPHRGEFSETVAFRIRGPRRSVLFLPDIDRWEEWGRSLEEELERVDIAYLDATFYDDSELPSRARTEIPHPPVVTTMALLDRVAPSLRSRVRFLHFNHTNPLLDPSRKARGVVESRGYRCAEEGDIVAL
ncbi:MAG: MBL fold metallo-hydrolase, partial [Candidatus Eisenbacteria bacterium]|nr:MBL fold metallo-hydrolase [Candidatus Eisenbacteria bacterium]